MSKKKITQQELDNLVNANRVFRDLKFKLADIEMSIRTLGLQKDIVMQQLDSSSNDLANEQKSIFDKYGDVSVNLQTGEYNYNYTGRGNGRTNRIAANANHNSLRTAHSLLHSTQRAKLQSAAQRPESRPPGPCAAAHLSWNAASSTPSTKARQVS